MNPAVTNHTMPKTRISQEEYERYDMEGGNVVQTFLMVDLSKPRSQDIISGGCATISLVAFS